MAEPDNQSPNQRNRNQSNDDDRPAAAQAGKGPDTDGGSDRAGGNQGQNRARRDWGSPPDQQTGSSTRGGGGRTADRDSGRRAAGDKRSDGDR